MSNSEEALKIWKALKPMVNRLIEEKTRSCVRAKKMSVSSNPTENGVGVKEPYGQEFVIPYSTDMTTIRKGDSVWAYWYSDNASTMHIVETGEGKSGQGGPNVVNGIGPASASGGQITIPFSTVGGQGGSVNFNIADTQFYMDGVAAAESAGYANGVNSVTITKGAWSGGQLSVTASNGRSVSIQLSQSAVLWNGNSASFVINDGNGSTGYTCTVDASSRYSAGETAGVNSVTVTDIGQITPASYSNQQYTVHARASASNGKYRDKDLTIDASAAYSAGGTAVDFSSETLWNNGSKTITLSNSKTKTVNIPDPSAWSGSYVGNKIMAVTATVGGKALNGTVDATDAYNAGYAAGWAAAKALISLNENVIKGPSDTVNGVAVDLYTVTVEGMINSITNNAPGYYTAAGSSNAYVNGSVVQYAQFSKTVHFS